MKKFKISLAAIFIFAFVTGIFAQTKFAPQTKRFIKQVEKYQKQKEKTNLMLKELQKNFPIITISGQSMIGALVKVNEDIIKEAELEKIEVQVNSKIKDIWSVKIPIDKVSDLGKIEGIIYIETDTKIKKKLDEAREDTYVDLVHEGWSLPQAITGDGVIVGIIDGGFDFTHPMFLDTSGTNLRISRVWDQPTSGTPPAGYSYGNELVGSTAILNAQADTTCSHGTHVAGIAAGSGIGTDGAYIGVAPSAEIVIINMNGGESALTDAVSYIFDYATSIGKPAVINMSLGSHIGPHDGTSLQDQAFDNLVGIGKILVGAAGNEGDKQLHASYTFNDDIINTIVFFEEDGNNVGSGTLDIWGTANTNFTIAVNIYDDNWDYIDWTPYYNTSNNPYLDTIFVINSDTISIEITGEASCITNNRPRFLVNIENPSIDYFISLELTSLNSTVHIWNHGHGNGANLADTITGFYPSPDYIAGDTDYTVGEIGGTAEGVITVGAYTTKNNYTNFEGQSITIDDNVPFGEIATFSSHGPTLDGRTKPEIVAPGNVVVSSVNSFDPNYLSGGNCWENVVMGVTNGTDTWFFAAMEGTSMATPFTTGVVALMLEANPELTANQVKEIIKDNARTDDFTGTIPPAGSNIWGWGKIDALDVVIEAINQISIEEIYSFLEYANLYPNPTKGNITIEFKQNINTKINIQISNLTGRIVFNDNIAIKNSNLKHSYNLDNLTNGLYLVKIFDENKSNQYKLIINR